MGFNDAVYRERKRRMRPLYERIKGGMPPHAVIECDRFQREMPAKAVDDQFRKNVCTAILKNCPRAK
jgi:hypothetical protein